MIADILLFIWLENCGEGKEPLTPQKKIRIWILPYYYMFLKIIGSIWRIASMLLMESLEWSAP